jgi:pilus assembly protein Flp/PilA
VKASVVKQAILYLCDDSGQGLVEYALILALIAVAAVTALSFLGQKNSNSLSNSENRMPG